MAIALADGIIGPEGVKTSTPECEKRLATGATVEQIALEGDRLNYKRLTGDGPDEGWISTKLKGKDLARRVEGEAEAATGGDTSIDVGTWKPLSAAALAKLPKLNDNDNIRPKTMKKWKDAVDTQEPGEYWGIKFPHSPAMLKEAGPEWLTMAMHTAGTMPKDNAVVKFTSFQVFAEDVTKQDLENAKFGGAGLKVLLTLEYKNGPSDTLGEGMFVKMPHAYTGKNERQKNSFGNKGLMDWSEVSFYNLFGGVYGDLPFKSPRMYFCDMSRKTSNFVNIVERIPFGQGAYFPAPDKYRDWELPNKGVDHYYAHAKALATFFGWHRNIRKVTDQVETVFMFKESQDVIFGVHDTVKKAGAYNSKQRDEWFKASLANPDIAPLVASNGFGPAIAKGFLEIFEGFIGETGKHCFPKEYVEKKYVDKFFKEAKEMGNYCAEMGWYSAMVPEYWSLVHPNAQVDNAFYWTNDSGDMQCGLLDWGGVSHSNIPFCLANGWIGPEVDVFDEHEAKLVQLFIDEYQRVTGFKIDFADLYMQIKLSQAAVLPGCCANLGSMLRNVIQTKDWKDVKDRFDPRIDHNFLARCYFVQVELFLGMWKNRSPYKYFKDWLKKTGIPLK